MSTLYQINNQIESFFEENVDQETGEILNYDLLEKLEIEKREKQHSVVKYIQHLENNEKAIKDEMDRLKTLKTVSSNRIDSLKNYLKNSMEIDNITSIDFETRKVYIAKNPPKLNIAENLFEEFGIVKSAEGALKLVKTDLANKKKEVKDKLKKGEEVEGAELSYSTSLRIK